MALRARPEPGIRPGGPLLLRTPAEPSSELAGPGCLLPGKQTRALREPGVRGRGARCQRGRPTPHHWAQVPWSLRPGSPGARGTLCPARPRRGPVGGSPWGPRAQGAGSGPPGPRDRFVYKHCRGLGGGPRREPRRHGFPGRGPGTCARSGASRARAVWRGGRGVTWRPGRCFFPRVRSLWGAGWELRAFSVPGVAGCPLETLGPGAPPSVPPPLGDWLLSRLRGALGRPWAEVTAAEFLPGRFPAPPQCPCQRGGREFTPARRN